MKTWTQRYDNHLVKDPSFTDNTRQGYRRDLADFTAAMEQAGVEQPRQLLPTHIQLYLQRLKQEGKSAATIARRFVSIRALCRFGVMQGMLSRDPTIGIHAPRVESKQTRTLSLTEVTKLLDAPLSGEPSAFTLRDAAMLELLYATGMKVSELIALNVDQFRQDLGALQSIGSSRRERMVPIGAAAIRKLQAYLAEGRPALIKADQPEQALFLNVRGRRLSRQSCWKIIRECARAAGLADDLTPHMLRKSFAVHLLENGADVQAVQEMLGHVSAQSTLLYRSTERAKVKETYDRAHPRAR